LTRGCPEFEPGGADAAAVLTKERSIALLPEEQAHLNKLGDGIGSKARVPDTVKNRFFRVLAYGYANN